jgi:hypothetical protein
MIPEVPKCTIEKAGLRARGSHLVRAWSMTAWQHGEVLGYNSGISIFIFCMIIDV